MACLDDSLPSGVKRVLGCTFGRLSVTGYAGTDRNVHFVNCRCSCGSSCVVRAYNLLSGNSKSCGCLAKELTSTRATRHGQGKSPEWITWSMMKSRCCNPSNKRFDRYGGRGIRVCDRWLNSFKNFLEDVGYRPSHSHSLDRINNDGNYEPGNCRWATAKQQSRNKCDNHVIEIDGVAKSAIEWSELSGVGVSTIIHRRRAGWDSRKAVFTPPLHRGGRPKIHRQPSCNQET